MLVLFYLYDHRELMLLLLLKLIHFEILKYLLLAIIFKMFNLKVTVSMITLESFHIQLCAFYVAIARIQGT
jgi:hypothetical protein